MENQHSSNGNQKRDFLLRLCVSVDLENREQWCAEPAWLVNAIRTAGDSRPYLRQVVSFFVGWIFLLLQQPGEVEAGHPVFVGKQIDHAFAGGAFAAGGHPCVVAGSGLDDALHWPRFAPVEAHVHGDVVAFVTATGAAEKQNVAVFEWQSQDSAFAAVVVRRAGEQVVVRAADILKRDDAKNSGMPSSFIYTLSDKDVADLTAWIMPLQ